LAARGDRRFLLFNAWWVVMAMLSMVTGAILKVRPTLEDAILDEMKRRPKHVRAAVCLALGLGWANAVLRRL
jgi:hypothetical protein